MRPYNRKSVIRPPVLPPWREEVDEYSHPKVGKDWRWLAGMADIVMTYQCRAFLEDAPPAPGRAAMPPRAMCLKGEACRCDLWSGLFKESRELTLALALVPDLEVPPIALAHKLFQFHGRVLGTNQVPAMAYSMVKRHKNPRYPYHYC